MIGCSGDVSTAVAGLVLDNPVLAASGCWGTGAESARHLDLASLGAVVTRSITRDPTTRSSSRRILETAAGLLVEGGLPGPGIMTFVRDELPALLALGARPVVSIAAAGLGEFAELGARLCDAPGVVAVEVNLAWGSNDHARWLADLTQARRALAVVRRETPGSRPVLAKLPCDLTSVVEAAAAVVEAGADAVVVAAPSRALRVDQPHRGASPTAVAGALCGPAVRPLVVRAVWEVHAALPNLPVIGVGGIRTGRDALEMLAAGAVAVQVGSASLADPAAAGRILAELTDLLSEQAAPESADLVREGSG